MENFRIRPVGEADIAKIVAAAGGGYAHPDADRRDRVGADFRLAEAVIELKELNDDGLEKPERQRKLATLFRAHEPERPVIVLDRRQLPEDAHPQFDRILEGPIKTAVTKGKGQLAQSRVEFPDSTCSILFIINNGYTVLNHEDIVRMVAHRVRNDTDKIDGVVVGGCYFYSDTIDSFFLWPLDYVPIKLDRPFTSFAKLKDAWDAYAEQCMTELMTQVPGSDATKGPVVDCQFDVDGVTYVKPAPPMGSESAFFRSGRPRKDNSGLTRCPPVGITFPNLSVREWSLFRRAVPSSEDLFDTYQDWIAHKAFAAESGTALQPFVAIDVTHIGWEAWRAERSITPTAASVRAYANELFSAQVNSIRAAARERKPTSILPPHYVLVVTEEIGQDRANDVSHLALVKERPNQARVIQPIAENLRIFHEHALALACAYAIAEGVASVLWQKDRTYIWS